MTTLQYSINNASTETPPGQVHLQPKLAEGPTSDGATMAAIEEGKGFTNIIVSLGKDKEPYVSRYRRVAAEAISTFILVFLGCGSIVVNEKSQGEVTYLGITLVFGLVILAMVKAVGHISGAHMNPAVTIAFASVREFPLSLVPFYIGAQVGGAICAAFALRAMFDSGLDEELGHLGATSPTGSNLQAFAMEFLLTLILMFVVSAVAVDSKSVGELAGLILGATITLNAIVGGAITGASMNPARSIGPAVAAHQYRSLWVYICAPPLGAVVGAWLYSVVHGPQALASESKVRVKSDTHGGERPGHRRWPLFQKRGN